MNIPAELDSVFLRNASHINVCLNEIELTEEAIQTGQAVLGLSGQVCVVTDEHTGRAAKDKYLVAPGPTSPGSGTPISVQKFEALKHIVVGYVNGRRLYVNDFVAGTLKCRLVTDRPTHGLFVRHMFDAVDRSFEAVDFTIVAMTECHADSGLLELNSSTFVALDFEQKLALIGGTKYAGEVKKSVFSYLSYLLPNKGVLPMHASVTTSRTDSTVFFGLSGTGKTTLSSSRTMRLVGDDEHGWNDEGLYNFESGCYAKLIKLSQENEPAIWEACNGFGVLLENVDMSGTRELDFDSERLTENTRGAYPLSAIENAHHTRYVAPHPKNIIMLTCDAYGVLPSVSKLSPEAAAYHFLSGYTAKVAGTEKGITEPTATFSSCFGEPFMPHPVSVYADLLVKKLRKHSPDVWLVNTGWAGGGYGVGKRIDIVTTRKIVDDIVSGKMRDRQVTHNAVFNLDVPVLHGYVNTKSTTQTRDPRDAWEDKDAYDVAAQKLVDKFVKNSEKFDVSDDIMNAGMPRKP